MPDCQAFIYANMCLNVSGECMPKCPKLGCARGRFLTRWEHSASVYSAQIVAFFHNQQNIYSTCITDARSRDHLLPVTNCQGSLLFLGWSSDSPVHILPRRFITDKAIALSVCNWQGALNISATLTISLFSCPRRPGCHPTSDVHLRHSTWRNRSWSFGRWRNRTVSFGDHPRSRQSKPTLKHQVHQISLSRPGKKKHTLKSEMHVSAVMHTCSLWEAHVSHTRQRAFWYVINWNRRAALQIHWLLCPSKLKVALTS